MKTTYFINCKTLDEVKKLYKNLALQHHPDRPGGNTEVMQRINAEYKSIIEIRYLSLQNNQTRIKRITSSSRILLTKSYTLISLLKSVVVGYG